MVFFIFSLLFPALPLPPPFKNNPWSLVCVVKILVCGWGHLLHHVYFHTQSDDTSQLPSEFWLCTGFQAVGCRWYWCMLGPILHIIDVQASLHVIACRRGQSFSRQLGDKSVSLPLSTVEQHSLQLSECSEVSLHYIKLLRSELL